MIESKALQPTDRTEIIFNFKILFELWHGGYFKFSLNYKPFPILVKSIPETKSKWLLIIAVSSMFLANYFIEK